jgi:hypothetical protein
MNERDRALLNSRILKKWNIRVEGSNESHLTADRGEKYSVRSIPGFIPVFLLWQLHKNKDFVKTGSRSIHSSSKRHNMVSWLVPRYICSNDQNGTDTDSALAIKQNFQTKYH